MIAVIHELDRRIFFIHLFEMKHLRSGTNTGVEILILKLDAHSELVRIEAER